MGESRGACRVPCVSSNFKRNFALFPVLDWIAEITTHIPNKGEQLIRYYGAYSNASRGKRRKEKVEEETRIRGNVKGFLRKAEIGGVHGRSDTYGKGIDPTT